MTSSRRTPPRRAALVTGASSGIGFEIARTLCRTGHAVTMVSRRAERLEPAAARLRDDGHDATAVVADVRDERDIARALAAHEARHGRLDVLANNAGFGIRAAIGETATRHIDLQLDVNLRAIMLFCRDALPLLVRAGAEHGNALVLNTASVSGKAGTEMLAVYSAAKHGVVGFTQALNRELNPRGVKACALCPGYVDTELSDFVKDEIPPQEMIQTSDVAAIVDALLRLSPWCVVPEVVMTRPGDAVVD